jgi:hypothetical protein
MPSHPHRNKLCRFDERLTKGFAFGCQAALETKQGQPAKCFHGSGTRCWATGFSTLSFAVLEPGHYLPLPPAPQRFQRHQQPPNEINPAAIFKKIKKSSQTLLRFSRDPHRSRPPKRRAYLTCFAMGD